MRSLNKTKVLYSVAFICVFVASLLLNIHFNTDEYYDLPNIFLLSLLVVMLLGADYSSAADNGYYDLHTFDYLSNILGQNGYKVDSRWGDDEEFNFYINQYRENVKYGKLKNFITALMCYLIPAIMFGVKIDFKIFCIVVVIFSIMYMIPIYEVFPSKKQKPINATMDFERYLPDDYNRLDDEDRYYKRINAYTNLKAEYCDALRLKKETSSFSDLIIMILPGLTLYGGAVLAGVAFIYNTAVSLYGFLIAFTVLNLVYIFL